MKYTDLPNNRKIIFPILSGFFVMGFADIVGIATNYVKVYYSLPDSVANLLPMMVFLWFAIFSIPAGILMGKAGRRNTVIISLVLTCVSMLIPFFFYNFTCMLLAFALLGIGNTILQVSLNPMVAAVVNPDKTASVLTLGQFMKAVSSFSGPVMAGLAVAILGNWIWIFPVYALASLISALWLMLTVTGKRERTVTKTTFSSTIMLLRDPYILLLFLGILCIVGIDVGLNTSIPRLLMEKSGMPVEKAGLGTSLYFAARTAGSLLGAIVLAKYAATGFFRFSAGMAIVAFIILLIAGNGWLIYSMIVVVGLLCANIFSIIFSFALHHKKDKSNEISALMVMGVSGGALFTPLMGIISDHSNQVYGMSVLLVCLFYLFYLSLKKQ